MNSHPVRRVGLLGFGSIAEHGHLPAWQGFAHTEICAVADVSPQRLARARELLPHAVLYESPEALIANAGVDTVDICTPPNTHADLILAARDQRIQNIVCEKPFVLTQLDYAKVARARGDSRIISINNWAHSDLNRHVLSVLRRGDIGAVRRVVLQTARPDCALGNGGWRPRWRTDAGHAGGGIVLDHGWHQLYLLLGWVAAPVRWVSAVTRTVDPRHAPVEDEAIIDLAFPEATGRLELSWTSQGRSNAGTVEGTDGIITIHDDCITVENAAGFHMTSFCGKLTESSYHPDWFEATFAYALYGTDRREADRNFTEAGKLVGLITAIYASGRAGGVPCVPTCPGDDAASAVTERTDLINVRGDSWSNSAAQRLV